MLHHLDLEKILFLDIETVPQARSYDELELNAQNLWDQKARHLVKDEQTPKDIYQRAGIYAEFGKIICISVGALKLTSQTRNFRIKSFYGHNEKTVLQGFAELLNGHYNTEQHQLCAHNGKEFDFPYLSRRMLVNQVPLPRLLDTPGKKPWEVNHLDTMELWKFGDYKHFTSLNLLANLFGIPTPKDDIQGSDVARVYWEEENIERIVKYCQKDVLTVVQLLLRFRGEPILENSEISTV